MTATSVTGIGLGHAKKTKGSEQQSLGVAKLVGPRIVAADAVNLNSSGTALVILPLLPGTAANYALMVTDADTTASHAGGGTITLDGTSTRLNFKGANNGALYYSIIRRGLAI